MEFSTQMQDVIAKVRRQINDLDISEDTLLFSDEEIYGYIVDACDELELSFLRRNRAVENGDFVNETTGQPVRVKGSERTIYALKAAIKIVQAIKARADRDNFALKKSNLSVDTSKQSEDHARTIEMLEKKLVDYAVGLSLHTLLNHGNRHSGDD